MHDVRGGPGAVVGGTVVDGTVVGGVVGGAAVTTTVVGGGGADVTSGGSPPSDSWGGGEVADADDVAAGPAPAVPGSSLHALERQQRRRWDEEGRPAGATRHLGRLYAARLAR